MKGWFISQGNLKPHISNSYAVHLFGVFRPWRVIDVWAIFVIWSSWCAVPHLLGEAWELQIALHGTFFVSYVVHLLHIRSISTRGTIFLFRLWILLKTALGPTTTTGTGWIVTTTDTIVRDQLQEQTDVSAMKAGVESIAPVCHFY